MAKAPTDIRSLARSHTETAVSVLAGIMMAPKAPPSARVAAAEYLIDRGWGKAPQVIAGDGDNPLQLAIRAIERVIVDPQPKQLQAKPLELQANPVNTIDDSVNKPLTIDEP